MSRTNDEHRRSKEILADMAAIRGELRNDAGALRSSTRRFLDWKNHVRVHPWGSLAVVAAVAYYLVPKRVEIRSPTEKELEKLAKKHRLVVDPDPAPSSRNTFSSGLTTLVTQMLVRGALGVVGTQLGKMFGPDEDESKPRTPNPPPQPAASPREPAAGTETAHRRPR